MPKQDADEKLRLKRLNYLDSALIATRLLDEEHFEDVAKALKKRDKGADAFKKVCKKAGIPEGMVDTIWETLLKVDSQMPLEPGWIPGPR